MGGVLGYFLRSPERRASNSETESAEPHENSLDAASAPLPEQAKTLREPLPMADSEALLSPALQVPNPKGDTVKKGLLKPIGRSAALRHDPQLMQERMQRLGPGQDTATRLAAAREILNDPTTGPLRLRALDVLAQLAPNSVLSELQAIAQGAADDPRSNALLMSAIQSLGRRADILTPETLSSLYEGGSTQVMIAAATALAARGDESLNLRFEQQRAADLSHKDAAVRIAALEDLAALGSESALALRRPLLKDESEEVRLAALRGLPMNADASAIESIRPLLEDSSERVRATASRMLAGMERRLERGKQLDPGPGGLPKGLGLNRQR